MTPSSVTTRSAAATVRPGRTGYCERTTRRLAVHPAAAAPFAPMSPSTMALPSSRITSVARRARGWSASAVNRNVRDPLGWRPASPAVAIRGCVGTDLAAWQLAIHDAPTPLAGAEVIELERGRTSLQVNV